MGLKYTNIQHDFRKYNDLSCNEYVVADMIYHLSHPSKSEISGWCYMSKEAMGKEIGLSKVSVLSIVKNLIEKGYIEKNNETKFLRTTDKWNEVYDFTIGKESLPQSVKKVYQGGKETLPNNIYYNNTNTITQEKDEKISEKELKKYFKEYQADFNVDSRAYFQYITDTLKDKRASIESLFMSCRIDLSKKEEIWKEFLTNASVNTPQFKDDGHVWNTFKRFIRTNESKFQNSITSQFTGFGNE